MVDDVLTSNRSPPWRVLKIAGAERALAFQTLAFPHYMSPRLRDTMRLSRMREALIGLKPDRTDWVKTVNAPLILESILIPLLSRRNFIKLVHRSRPGASVKPLLVVSKLRPGYFPTAMRGLRRSLPAPPHAVKESHSTGEVYDDLLEISELREDS